MNSYKGDNPAKGLIDEIKRKNELIDDNIALIVIDLEKIS